MALKLQEFEDFMQVLIDQDMEKIEEPNLKKAVRHYWDIGTPVTVESRIKTLKEEGWIEKKPNSKIWKINHDQEPGIEKLFQDKKA